MLLISVSLCGWHYHKRWDWWINEEDIVDIWIWCWGGGSFFHLCGGMVDNTYHGGYGESSFPTAKVLSLGDLENGWYRTAQNTVHLALSFALKLDTWHLLQTFSMGAFCCSLKKVTNKCSALLLPSKVCKEPHSVPKPQPFGSLSSPSSCASLYPIIWSRAHGYLLHVFFHSKKQCLDIWAKFF